MQIRLEPQPSPAQYLSYSVVHTAQNLRADTLRTKLCSYKRTVSGARPGVLQRHGTRGGWQGIAGPEKGQNKVAMAEHRPGGLSPGESQVWRRSAGLKDMCPRPE